MNALKIDAIDEKILLLLQEDASLTSTEIAKKVHFSIQSVNKRINKMREKGLIERYSVVTSPNVAGKPITSMVSVVLSSPDYMQGLLDAVRENRNITLCFAVTGEYDYLLQMYAPTVEEMNRQIIEIKRIPGVVRTETALILAKYKNEITVLPDVSK